jgi:hypothetical protein
MDAQQMTMATIGLWVLFLAYASQGLLSDFHARKLCHAGCGLGMMLLDSTRLDARLFVWSVAASSIAMTWNLSPLPPFRFARPRDVGITVYLILVSCWFYASLPPTILAPLFFADPAGAVVCFCLSTIHPCDMPDQIGRSSLRFLRWGRPPRATSGQCTTPVGTVKRRSWERLRCSPSLTLPSRLKHLAGRGAPSQPPPQWWKPLAASTTTSQLGWLCSLDGRPVAAAAERSCVGLFQVGTSAVLSHHGSRDKPGHERVLRSCADASFVVLACSIL